jgi:hypothetical protein
MVGPEMTKNKAYENYPLSIPFIAVLLSLLTYLLGAYIISGFGIIFSIFYLIYCFGVELSIILRSCKNCYYYDKLCGIGKGKIAPYLVKKGYPEKFAKKKISFIQLLPDFLVAIIPIIAGIILLVQSFSWIILGSLVLLFLLFFGGTAIIRGSLVCKYCKQREIGCPAEKLLNKK